MKHGITALALGLAASCAQADNGQFAATVQQPVAAGQTWTYKRVTKTPAGSTESRTIFRIAAHGQGGRLVIESLPAQLTGRPTVWHKGATIDSDSCMVDFFGTGSLGILQSCSTTFVPGMDWTTEDVVKGTRLQQRYEVLDLEQVTVPAGSFNAVKIEGHWSTARAGGKPTHHVTYWYAPQARAMVKVHREFLNSRGAVESETMEELQNFRQTIAR